MSVCMDIQPWVYLVKQIPVNAAMLGVVTFTGDSEVSFTVKNVGFFPLILYWFLIFLLNIFSHTFPYLFSSSFISLTAYLFSQSANTLQNMEYPNNNVLYRSKIQFSVEYTHNIF